MTSATYPRFEINGCLADKERYGKVNPMAMQVGGEWREPETLLVIEWRFEPAVVSADDKFEAKQVFTTVFAYNEHGWNTAPDAEGNWRRIVDSRGNPPYQAWSVFK